MKKIALLFNLNRGQYEYETEFDSELTIDSIYNALKHNYEVEKIEADRDFLWINMVRFMKPDLVFNICEGYNGPARESVYAAILEQFHFKYSGPDSTNLLICHNKYLVKNLLKDIALVPSGYAIQKIEDIEKITGIKYPAFVKLNSEGSSMGMNKKSIVNNFDELKKQATWLLNEYERNVLVEEYIRGEDISIIYVEGLGILGPCEVKCDAEFYDYDMKTINDSTVDIKEKNGDFSELKETVNRIVRRLDIKGYAKLDFRVKENKYYLIEVNSQVSFHPLGEFVTCVKTDNYDFKTVINHIVSNALSNNKNNNSMGVNYDIE